ncbi:DUF5996 family protein [Segetibacter koreensis]|uniref:DUF5996 family protein n=1 Tax=Segetibacter koreensis TaxID=398037 RepID=UPI00037EA2A0|nr:DUF5996 family protein [Segetibacter koreensis]
MNTSVSVKQNWPEIPFNDWKDTFYTVQLWLQIVGKIRLRKMPWTNHSWHVTFYVSPVGLTTGSIPYENGVFQIDFDFQHHQVLITSSEGRIEKMDLYPRTVASFYKELFDKLENMGIRAVIYAVPNEIEPAIPFKEDETHKSYDKEKMNLYWKALISAHNVFTRFRARFIGKCSPVHVFWGAFDLAVTKFSGRKAPKHPGGMPNIPLKVMQESYSHEVSSCGFWPGSEQFPMPAFYAYCYPTPAAFGEQEVRPKEAFYSKEMGEFFLPYDVVRQAENPEETLLQFLQSTYEAAAKTGNWDREKLEFDFSEFER